MIKLRFGACAAAVLALCALALPGVALAASKARIDWVTLAGPSGQTAANFGGQDMTVTGTAGASSAAPSFAPATSGWARVSVNSGAVILRIDGGTAAEAAGLRVDQCSQPVLVPVQPGGTLSLIEASDKTAGCGGNSGGPYALLTNASATGAPVAGILGGSYIWSCTGTFGGATLTLKTLGPDGATYVTVATMTSATNTGVAIGGNATAEVVVTGGPPSAIYCSLS